MLRDQIGSGPKWNTSYALRGRAFTLVELLVVIAIIAVLAAILFPVFAVAKRSAKRVSALANMKQIAMAAHLYLGDFDDRLPPRFHGLATWPGYDTVVGEALGPEAKGFSEFLGSYIKDHSVWHSSEDRLSDQGLYTSFDFNEQLAFAWSLSSISRPSEAIYANDRSDINREATDTYVWWEFIDSHPFSENNLPGKIEPVNVARQIDPIRYVGNTGAYLFLDGHSAAMDFYRTWGDANHNLHLATKP